MDRSLSKREPTTTLYSKADPSIVAVPDRERFYDVGYRSELRAMLDHVVEIEGPIYLDVLIDRIARAHGFQRSGETVQRIIRAALGRHRFPATRTATVEIIWPQNIVPKRRLIAAPAVANMATCRCPSSPVSPTCCASQGLEDEEDLIRGIQEHFGLGRLAISTRQRFEAAIVSML